VLHCPASQQLVPSSADYIRATAKMVKSPASRFLALNSTVRSF